MSQDQYQFPSQSGEQPLQAALRIADSFQYSAENQPEAYRALKDIGDRVHSYRRTALGIELNREKTVFENIIGFKRQRISEDALVNQEWKIGGEPFGPGNTFGLEHEALGKNEQDAAFSNWYHTREIYDSFGRLSEKSVLRFMVSPREVIKMYNGLRSSLTVQELETLTRAIELYEERVREALYPLDQEIYDLRAEEEAERTEEYEAARKRTGQAIVNRAVADLQAKQAEAARRQSPVDDQRRAA